MGDKASAASAFDTCMRSEQAARDALAVRLERHTAEFESGSA